MSTNEATPGPARRPRRCATSGRRPAPSCCRWCTPTPTRWPASRRRRAARRASSTSCWSIRRRPTAAIWIRSQHRVGRRSRENMIWPQVSLAQMAALLQPTYSVRVIDAVAERMDWTDVRGDRPQGAAALLRHPADRADAAERPLRHLPGQAGRRRDDGLRHPHHADAARDAAPLPVARLRAARRAGPHAARSHRSPRGQPVLAPREHRDALQEARRRLRAAQVRHRREGLQLHEGAGLAPARRGGGQPGSAVHRRPRRPADAALRPAAARQVPDAAAEGPVLLHRHQPRLPGRLHLLHQARLLRADDADALGQEAGRGDQGAGPPRRPQHPHVCRPVHGEQGDRSSSCATSCSRRT